MSTRLTDAELAAFVSSVRVASDYPHQDFGDVGFVFEDLEEHLVLEELISARKVISVARRHRDLPSIGDALRGYDALFSGSADE
jgi:hypothetical protein